MIMMAWQVLLVTISLLICFGDVRFRIVRIEFVLLVTMLCLLILNNPASGYFIQSLLILAFGIALSYFRLLGGGDTKLLAAYAIAIKPALMPTILVIIGLCGGVLSVIYWLLNKYHLTKQPGIPYAIPIVIGGVIGVLASN